MEGLPVGHRDNTLLAWNVLNQQKKITGYLIVPSNAKIWNILDKTFVLIHVPEGNNMQERAFRLPYYAGLYAQQELDWALQLIDYQMVATRLL